MRRMVWPLLLLFVFTIPWEYSLDMGEPLGNVARIAGLLVLLAAIPAVLQAGRLRAPGLLPGLALALYLWICCTGLWSIDVAVTWSKMRAFFQEMMIVWLLWEFVERPRDLRVLLRIFVAGSWVLAILTVLSATSPAAIAAGQARFAAYGQDPNDVARFLDLGLPVAALLAVSRPVRWERWLAFGYLPLGLVAVLLTASRGGFVAALAALAGCGLLLVRGRPRAVLAGVLVLPAAAGALWLALPEGIFERLGTIPDQLTRGDLNQRLNIWSAGWQAFVHAPLLGTGIGTFVSAAGLAPIDTAHNTALALAVGGGLCALSLAVAIAAVAACTAWRMRGTLHLALITAFIVWLLTSLVATVEESRTTWLLLGLIAVSGRLAEEDGQALDACFPDPGVHADPEPAVSLA